jgi:hypothetical protein
MSNPLSSVPVHWNQMGGCLTFHLVEHETITISFSFQLVEIALDTILKMFQVVELEKMGVTELMCHKVELDPMTSAFTCHNVLLLCPICCRTFHEVLIEFETDASDSVTFHKVEIATCTALLTFHDVDRDEETLVRTFHKVERVELTLAITFHKVLFGDNTALRTFHSVDFVEATILRTFQRVLREEATVLRTFHKVLRADDTRPIAFHAVLISFDTAVKVIAKTFHKVEVSLETYARTFQLVERTLAPTADNTFHVVLVDFDIGVSTCHRVLTAFVIVPATFHVVLVAFDTGESTFQRVLVELLTDVRAVTFRRSQIVVPLVEDALVYVNVGAAVEEPDDTGTSLTNPRVSVPVVVAALVRLTTVPSVAPDIPLIACALTVPTSPQTAVEACTQSPDATLIPAAPVAE